MAADGFSEYRAAAVVLQGWMRELLATDKRVRVSKQLRWCGLPYQAGLSVSANEGLERWHIGLHGLTACRNMWVCPYCAPQMRYVRALGVDAVVRHYLSQGLRAVMMVSTVHHLKNTDWQFSMGAIGVAHRFVLSHRRASSDRLRRDTGLLEWFSAWDLLVGINGLHPHKNTILIINSDMSLGELRQRFERIYLPTLQRYGTYAEAGIGIVLTELNEKNSGAFSNYVTTSTHALSGLNAAARRAPVDDKLEFTLGLETLAQHLKKNVGDTSIDLLVKSYEGDNEAAANYLRLAGLVHRKKLFSSSAGWRQTETELGALTEDDADLDAVRDIFAVVAGERITLAVISVRLWNNHQAHIRALLEAADMRLQQGDILSSVELELLEGLRALPSDAGEIQDRTQIARRSALLSRGFFRKQPQPEPHPK